MEKPVSGGETLGLAMIADGDWSAMMVDEMKDASRKVANRLREYGFKVIERQLFDSETKTVEYSVDLTYTRAWSNRYTAKWSLRNDVRGTFHKEEMGAVYEPGNFYSWSFIGPTVRSAIDRDPQPLLDLFANGGFADKCGLAIILEAFPSLATLKALLLGCTGGGILRENCLSSVTSAIGETNDPKLKEVVSAAFRDPLWLSTVNPEPFLKTRGFPEPAQQGVEWALKELQKLQP